MEPMHGLGLVLIHASSAAASAAAALAFFFFFAGGSCGSAYKDIMCSCHMALQRRDCPLLYRL
eukprot:4312200-Amphidinium_carterae.1